MASSQSEQRRQVSLTRRALWIAGHAFQAALDKQRQEMLSEYERQREAMIKVRQMSKFGLNIYPHTPVAALVYFLSSRVGD